MLNYMDHFARSPQVCNGHTVIKGTRVPLQVICPPIVQSASSFVPWKYGATASGSMSIFHTDATGPQIWTEADEENREAAGMRVPP